MNTSIHQQPESSGFSAVSQTFNRPTVSWHSLSSDISSEGERGIPTVLMWLALCFPVAEAGEDWSWGVWFLCVFVCVRVCRKYRGVLQRGKQAVKVRLWGEASNIDSTKVHSDECLIPLSPQVYGVNTNIFLILCLWGHSQTQPFPSPFTKGDPSQLNTYC